MRVLIYSDVHGNLPAFETMLEKEKEVDTTISLGDLVNYAPWSNECVDLAVQQPHLALLMGNHEEAFLNGAYPGNNELVQSFFSICFPEFTKSREIRGFTGQYQLGKFCMRHTIDNRYVYPDTQLLLNDNYIIGHSHHQFLYENSGFQLFNAGSVGQNRAYINVINYLILTTEDGKIEMKQLIYDVDRLIKEMKARHYPESCIAYYSNKKRA